VDRFYNFVLKHPLWVVLITLITTLALALGGQKLEFKSDYRVYFDDDNAEFAAFESMQRIYTKSDNVALVVASDDSIFTHEHLAAIHWLTEQGWQTPYSTRVDSITNFQHTFADGDDLIVEDLLLETELLSDEKISTIRDVATNEPLLKTRLVSDDEKATIVNITVQLPGVDRTKEQPEVTDYIEQLALDFKERFPDLTLHLSGIIMMNDAFVKASDGDMHTLIPMMFLIVVVFVYLFLRSWAGTVATLLVIVTAILCTMGLVGWNGGYLTSPTAGVPIIIMTLAIADSVHILVTYFQERPLHTTKRLALLSSLRINGLPVFLTSLTTAIGFLSLNFSDSPPFRQLGNYVATGVVFAYLFSMAFLPALLMLLPHKVPKPRQQTGQWMQRLSHSLVRHAKRYFSGSLVVVVALCALIPLNTLDDRFVAYFGKELPFRQASDFMEEHMTGLASIEISVDTQTADGINDPDFLKTLEAFNQWAISQTGVKHINSVLDTLRRLNQNMHADDPAFYRLPEEREMVAQYLLLYEMSLPFGLDLNNQLNVDKSATRIILSLDNLTSTEQMGLEASINEWLDTNAPELKVTLASPSLMFSHIGQRNIISMLEGVFWAFVLISVIFGIAQQSLRYAFYSLLPNLLPASAAFGVWALIDGQVGLALSVVAGMTLGIVVDDTIHFLSKYRYARVDKSLKTTEAIHHTFQGVGQALWVTTCVLVAGFLVLAQSSFLINADLGLLTAITLVIALLVDFLFLPALLLLFDGNKASNSAQKVTS
jgi:predicted RND superfamily exporter protein